MNINNDMNLPKSIHQIVQIQFKNSKIFQLLRRAHPPTHPCARNRVLYFDDMGKTIKCNMLA